MKADELLALCKSSLVAAGIAEAEVWACVRHRGFARFAIGELGQHMEVEEPQVLVRVGRGLRVAEASTSRLEEAAIVSALRGAEEAARFVPERDDFDGFARPEGVEVPVLARCAAATVNASAEQRVAILSPVLATVRAAGLTSAGALETSHLVQCVATTRGLGRAHASSVAMLRVWALETAGAGGASGYGGHMHRDVRKLDVERVTEVAVRRCRMGRGPLALEAGTYDVVMEPEAVSELVEWLAAVAFSASDVEQGTSPLAGRIGQRITGTGVTLIEDPLDPGDLGFGAPFDREGTARTRVPLIEHGVARGMLHDRATAKRMGAASTGSSLVSDLGGSGGIGASAVHMEGGGARSVDELIAGMDRGLYVCRLHYVNGLLEPRRAVMTGLTRDGCFLVEKGRVTRAVGNLRFTDSFLEGLARCDGMTQQRLAVPTSWSDAGACVVPAVRMRGFRFTGGSSLAPAS